jgi:hypothetical protein
MKRNIERGAIILIITLLPVFLSGFNFPDFPGNANETGTTILDDTDVVDFHERLLNSNESVTNLEVLIYNQESELLYKHSFSSGDDLSKDEKLRKLLPKCDLLVKSETSALYILK